MEYSQSQQYWIWLSSIKELDVRHFDALLERLGPPQRVWEEMGPYIREMVGPRVYRALEQARQALYLEALFASLEQCGAVAVTREDETYPQDLLTIADPPPTLYVRGRAALDDPCMFAIVGARNCSAYGTRMTRRIARELSEAGVTVVSGLARGIDSAAHRGAVDARARTVAVLGCGIDVVYPPENRTLYEEILANGGSIVTEEPPGTPPLAHNFPARNRIISGMSRAVLLVEAARHSGAMSTVRHAIDQSRDVMALPGQADSVLSSSPHALIRDGARLVASAKEILEDLGWDRLEIDGRRPSDEPLQLTAAEQQVYNALAGGSESVDQLVDALRIKPADLNCLLTSMEIRGIIRQLPGRRVERIV